MINVDQIYEATAAPSHRLHPVESPHLLALNRAVRETERIAREENTIEIVSTYLSPAKSVRFLLAATPLPGAAQSLRLASLATRASASEDELKWRVSAGVLARFREIAPALDKLSREETSPIATKLLEIWGSAPTSDLALAFPDAGSRRHSEQWALDHGFECLLTPAALRGSVFHQHLFVLGSPRWYVRAGGSFIFQTPRCARMDVIGYRWTDINIRKEPAFIAAGGAPIRDEPRQQTVVEVPIGNHSSPVPEAADAADAFELPSIDVQSWLRSRNSHPKLPGLEDADEEVDAKLVMLAGAHSVFLPFTEEARSFVAYLASTPTNNNDDEEEELASVRRTANRELEVGDFILLRSSEAGDIIPETADNIMGPTMASQRRGHQKRWKDGLRSRLKSVGSEVLSEELRAAGAVRATYTNIRNWMNSRSLRPAADEDFQSILKVVGLGSDTATYFENAAFLLSLHHSAGNQVRRLLIAEVRKANHTVLRRTGMMTFRLQEIADGASMTAYRIERILPEIVKANYGQVNTVFEQKDCQWQ